MCCVPGLRTVPFLMVILVITLHVFFVSWRRLLLNRDLPVTLAIKHWSRENNENLGTMDPGLLSSAFRQECSTVLLKLLCKKRLPLSTARTSYNQKKLRITHVTPLLLEEPQATRPTPSPPLLFLEKQNMLAFLILFLFLLWPLNSRRNSGLRKG